MRKREQRTSKEHCRGYTKVRHQGKIESKKSQQKEKKAFFMIVKKATIQYTQKQKKKQYRIIRPIFNEKESQFPF